MEIKLNLIPDYRKEEIRRSSLLRVVLRWEIEIVFILAGFFLLLVSLNQILQIKLDSQTAEIGRMQDKAKYDRLKELDENFKSINAKIAMDKSIQEDQLYWSRMFERIENDVPENVSVLKIANKNYKVLLAGQAMTRDDLLKLEDSFSRDECFAEVDLPLSNLVSKDNVSFQIEFTAKEECIKNR